ncbi:hypothetical protein AYL99_08699 [Fonsecaea erecta]|uniref:Carboxylic ester hydrolase n=1 Tax=Fonsecaea erecta TaxID=1367422 RepID=A0A178Z9Y7_9EURO|nr:hypothetical protein AYL99_08699 [Fonsecaea erecta]OAP56587.1 hypothetical protein AYL99_08699 [Fonsecaea erecta]
MSSQHHRLYHRTLCTYLRPATYETPSSSGKKVTISQYRGIPFGKISARFEPSNFLDSYDVKELDCTKFGPRCPQNKVDVGELLRVPKVNGRLDLGADEDEDELRCLNLVVTVPDGVKPGDCVPVMVWIHGGGLMVTYASVQSGICDPSLLVADSARLGKPIIVVSINYRLNIFGFGDLSDNSYNLGLEDQALAINWISKHIGGFGGDPNQVTLAGESAGAFCVHALSILGVPIRRAILQSGTLYTSPPQPFSLGKSVIEQLEKRVRDKTGLSLRRAPISSLLTEVQTIQPRWNHAGPILRDWINKEERIEALLIGDCQNDGIIWRKGIEACGATEIVSAFDACPRGQDLMEAYNIHPDRLSTARLGALDFLTDVRFAWGIDEICVRWVKRGRSVYRYFMDEPNPWQASVGATHAVDLVFLFGGQNLKFRPSAEKVGEEMRSRWITFINGKSPWASVGGTEVQAIHTNELRDEGGADSGPVFAFGPFGRCELLQGSEVELRRRRIQWKLLREIGFDAINAVATRLGSGRSGLDN